MVCYIVGERKAEIGGSFQTWLVELGKATDFKTRLNLGRESIYMEGVVGKLKRILIRDEKSGAF